MVTPDVFFIQTDEPNADENWQRLLSFAPHAVRIGPITGIHAAHRACAEVATTSHFIAVDADNFVLSDNPFLPRDYDDGAVYVWRARNPCNGLIYGNGAIKALPRDATRALPLGTLDMTSTISNSYNVVDVLASEHRFNTSGFNAWRTAFRECVKLSSKGLPNHIPADTLERLNVWCGSAKSPFGFSVLLGAKMGREYGQRHHGDVANLRLINDYTWLRQQYNAAIVTETTDE